MSLSVDEFYKLYFDFNTMPIKELSQRFFYNLALGTHAVFGLCGVDLQSFRYRFG